MTSHELSTADRDLWQRAAGGDADARQHLVERAWRMCAFRLRRFGGEEQRELQQNIAAAVLRALASGIAPERHLDGLLEWRGRAEITAFVRAKIRERRVQPLDALLLDAGHEPTPYDNATSAELRRHLHECIERIPNRDQREATRQRLVAGLSAREVAAERVAEPSAVRVWIARGAALVRACIERKLGRHGGA